MNLPEKILFVIDTAREQNCTPFKLSKGASYMPLLMIKRVIENFICIKSVIRNSHEYALMTLNSDGVQWNCDFTNRTDTIIDHLDLINEDVIEDDQNSYDFGPVFDTIQKKVLLPVEEIHDTIRPTFIVRIILIYSRSNSIPIFETGKEFLDAVREKYFFIDVLYVHEPPSLENASEEIHSKMAALDIKNDSYIFETGRNAAKLHENMAKLLGHPLLRPHQRDACYTIPDILYR